MMHILRLLSCYISISILCTGCTSIFGNDEELNSEELFEKYFSIAKEDLNGWKQGYTDGNNYIVGTHLSDSDSTIFMLSTAEKTNSHIYILFDEDNSLIGFGTEDNWIVAHEGEDKIYLSWLDDKDNICGDYYKVDIDSKDLQVTKATSTELLFDYDKLSKTTGVLGYIENAKNINNHTIEQEWGLLAKDLSSLSLSVILDLLKVSAKLNIAVFLGELWYDGFVSTHYQRFQMAMYSECSTEITGISADGEGNINVFVTVRNADMVPSVLLRNYYPIEEDITNTVYCGITGREGVYPTSVKYTEPYKEEGVLDRNWGKEYYLMYTFPKPISHERYVFRSYLKSTRILNDKGQVSNGYIKYSSPYYFYDIGFIDEFSQESVSENEEEYIFKCKVHASINSLENVSSWGIYYDNGDLYPQKFSPTKYSEPSISSQSSADFEMKIRIKKSDFGNDTYKDIKLGIYSYSINDNNTKWGTTQTFTLNIDDRWVDLGLPSGILWAAYNVGASSPEEYGDYYAWGETETKVTYSFSNYKHARITGYDEKGHSIIEYDNLGYNISGTKYDAAHVKWEDGARMPTFRELQELADNCTWQAITSKGKTLVKVTGRNGNSILIPYASARYDGENGEGGGCDEGAIILSSNIDKYNEANALVLYYNQALDLYGVFPREFGGTIRPVKDPE